MTTDRATLLGLADRCEKASGPSRELDFAIFRVLHPEYAGPEWKEYAGGLRHINDCSDMRCMPPAALTPPRWTASLDAALSLVPEGWKAEIHTWGCVHLAVTSGHPLFCKRGQPEPQSATVLDRPALALTAAALRALAQEAPSDER